MAYEEALTGRAEETDLLARYRSLEAAEAQDDVRNLRLENRELDRLINDAAALFALTEVGGMMAFVISRLNERFIPQRLFVIIERTRGDGYDRFSYRNLKSSDDAFPLSYYTVLKEHFLGSPYSSSFTEIEAKLGATSFGADLRALEPELIFPMLGIGGVHGLVVLGTKLLGGDYSEIERMYVDRIIRFLSIGIQNSLHHESAITDPKTRLFNHAYFMRVLDQEIARIARHGGTAGLMMLDIDHFKHFNDRYGHLAGDEVLSALARELKCALRAEDVAARFGGEEFCVLATACAADSLFEVAERIRGAIQEMRVPYKDSILSVTASIGCCLLDRLRIAEASRCIDRADKALYLSKEGGRNRTTIYRPGLLDRAESLRSRKGPNAGCD